MRRLVALVAVRWRGLTGSASAAAAVLGLLACLCTLLAVVGPRAAAQLRTSAFRHFIVAAPAAAKAMVGTADYSALSGPGGLTTGKIQAAGDLLRRHLRELPLAPATADWFSVTTKPLPVADNAPAVQSALPPRLELSYRTGLQRNLQVVAGRLPASEPGSGATVTVQAAVTRPVARAFGLGLGSRVAVPGTGIVLRVTGIVTPRNPAAPFWTLDTALAAPGFVQVGTQNGYWLGGVFIAPGAVTALLGRVDTTFTQVTWMFPLDLGHLTAAQALQLRPVLVGAVSSAGFLTGIQQSPIAVALTSGTVALLADFAAVASAVGSVLDLLAVSLAVLAAVVVLLAAWLLAEQRRLDFAVLRARGAARRQLALLILGVSAVTAVPGAAVGAAVAVALTPAAPAALSWWLAGLEVLAAVAGPVLITIRLHRGYAPAARPDQPPSRLAAARRLVVEAGLVLGAAGGLIVLRDQGAGAGDVYPSAAPILLAVGVAVVVLRLYPLLVRGLLRLTGQRTGPAAFLGLARAVRVPASATLPVVAMVLALALVAFAGMVSGAVIRGEVAASWQQVGADAVISDPGPVSAALDRAVAAVPGVQHVAAVAVTGGSAGAGRQFGVVLVDPARYAALLAATPLPPPAGAFGAVGGYRAGGLPALASPGVAAELGGAPVSVLVGGRLAGEPGTSVVRVRVVGRTPASMTAVAGLGSGYLVLPRQALGAVAPAPDTLLVGGPGVSRSALAAAVTRFGPGATVVFRSRVLAGLRSAPLQHGAYLALVLGAFAAAGGCLLVLLLSLLLSASARELAMARMSTMGLSPAQGRLLGVIELLPQLLAVLAGGLASAVALVPLIGPALSLAVFTGSASGVPVRVEPAWLAATGVGLLVLAIATLTGQTMLTERNAARSLRVGE